MLFVKTDKLKTGMRLAKPIYNKNGVMLYERNSRLTHQGIVSIQNFGLIGVYILEAAEPVPPMSEDDIEFERFQAVSVFSIKEILDKIAKKAEPEGLYPFANQVIKRYGNLHRKINFVQNLRSAEDCVYKHALNTSILSALMTKKLKFEFKQQLDVVVAGLIYDVGSLLVPVSLRKIKNEDLTEEDRTKVNTYRFAGYQIINQDYNLDPSVKRNATLLCKDLYHLSEEEDSTVPVKKILEVDILKVAAAFDKMTAMNYDEEPHSEVAALRYLMDGKNGFDKDAVQALVDSINFLTPGACVELNNGEKGLVVAEGAMNALQPFILSFKDNRIINLADSTVEEDFQIKDIMKTMDNRHVVDNDMLKNYMGNTVR